MLLLVAGFASASPPFAEAPQADVQSAFEAYAAAGDFLVPSFATAPPGVNDGSNLLDVYRAGDLALAVDTDGAWFAEAVNQIVSTGDLNWILGSISGAFYDHFEDDYQYLTVLLIDAPIDMFFAFYSPLSNDIRGLGYDGSVGRDIFDTSDNSLEGFIFMNEYKIWADDPVSGRYVFGQEFMHRWGSFVDVSHPELAVDALRGRDSAHWSYWYDTPNSPMEGNEWVDQEDGTWAVDFAGGSTYSDLDLYLMGLLGPEDVGPQTFLSVSAEEQDRVNRESGTTPEFLVEAQTRGGRNVQVTATPVTFTIDDIIAAEGEREPGVADSPKVHRMAFVVLVLADNDVTDATLGEIDALRQTFEADWEEDVRGLADLDTTLGDGDAPNWWDTTETTDTAVTDTGESETTDDTDDQDAPPPGDEGEVSGCGCGSAGAGTGLGTVLIAVAAMRRRR